MSYDSILKDGPSDALGRARKFGSVQREDPSGAGYNVQTDASPPRRDNGDEYGMESGLNSLQKKSANSSAIKEMAAK